MSKDSVLFTPTAVCRIFRGTPENMNLSCKGSRSTNDILTVWKPWRNVNDAALLEVFKLAVKKKEKHDTKCARMAELFKKKKKGQCSSLA